MCVPSCKCVLVSFSTVCIVWFEDLEKPKGLLHKHT